MVKKGHRALVTLAAALAVAVAGCGDDGGGDSGGGDNQPTGGTGTGGGEGGGSTGDVEALTAALAEEPQFADFPDSALSCIAEALNENIDAGPINDYIAGEISYGELAANAQDPSAIGPDIQDCVVGDLPSLPTDLPSLPSELPTG